MNIYDSNEYFSNNENFEKIIPFLDPNTVSSVLNQIENKANEEFDDKKLTRLP